MLIMQIVFYQVLALARSTSTAIFSSIRAILETNSQDLTHGIRRAQGRARRSPSAGNAADGASTQPFSQAT